MTSLATAWSISFAPLLVASFNVMVGSYLAWIGQIGMQLVLPAQARRFRYGWELRAAGRLLTLIAVTGFSIPRNRSPHRVNCASALGHALIEQRRRNPRHRDSCSLARKVDTEKALLLHVRRKRRVRPPPCRTTGSSFIAIEPSANPGTESLEPWSRTWFAFVKSPARVSAACRASAMCRRRDVHRCWRRDAASFLDQGRLVRDPSSWKPPGSEPSVCRRRPCRDHVNLPSAIAQLGGIRTLRHLGVGLVETLHVVVDIRLNAWRRPRE